MADSRFASPRGLITRRSRVCWSPARRAFSAAVSTALSARRPVVQEGFTGGGETDASAGSLQQFHSEAGLRAPHRFGQGRLRDGQGWTAAWPKCSSSATATKYSGSRVSRSGTPASLRPQPIPPRHRSKTYRSWTCPGNACSLEP
ncbi:hypothetical protein RVR_10531 [Actinacidiphila reveromycinica]|uniref:Uncharacterized protein n=1 Tax=Actinacidiphila reveromycinica TaxID=659352 RepID=A0A7U3UY03_9ACTN|nr:hypothetical protein RVR_10531 [Streptomyces sp. SN-593]